MSLYDLLNDSPNLNITINAGQLIEVIDYAIKKSKEEFTPEQEETLITTTAAAKMLGIDRSSLWRWHKSDYLIPVEVGGKRKYKLSEVKRILEGK